MAVHPVTQAKTGGSTVNSRPAWAIQWVPGEPELRNENLTFERREGGGQGEQGEDRVGRSRRWKKGREQGRGRSQKGGEGRREERVEVEKGKKGRGRVRFQALGIVSFEILHAFTKKISG